MSILVVQVYLEIRLNIFISTWLDTHTNIYKLQNIKGLRTKAWKLTLFFSYLEI